MYTRVDKNKQLCKNKVQQEKPFKKRGGVWK